MDLEGIMLGEISQAEKDEYYMISLTGGAGLIPSMGTKIPQAVHSSQNKQKTQ